MDPISFAIELEIGTVLLAAISAVFTVMHHRHHKQHQRQRERHFQEMMTRTGKVAREEVSLLRDIDEKETAPLAARAARARNSRTNTARAARATGHSDRPAASPARKTRRPAPKSGNPS